MPQYMLDTDTVSFALRGQGRVAARLLEHRPSQLCISSITLAELRFGAEARRSRKLHRLISTFVEAVAVVPLDLSTVSVPLVGVKFSVFDLSDTTMNFVGARTAGPRVRRAPWLDRALRVGVESRYIS